MSIALGTIIIFIIVLPGIVFKINYFTTDFAKRDKSKSFANDLIWAIIPSFLFHTIGLTLAYEIAGFKIDYMAFGHLITGTISPELLNKILNDFHANILPILTYNIWINLSAIFIGNMLRNIVRAFSLDIRWKLFRFNNKWCYLLTGESMQFHENYGDYKIKYSIDGLVADILVDREDKSLIYTGELLNFYTNRKGDLETLVLSGTYVKEFDTIAKRTQYKEIPDTEFIIPYKNVCNLNLRFYSLSIPNEEENINFYRKYLKYIDNLNYSIKIMIHLFWSLLFSKIALLISERFCTFRFFTILIILIPVICLLILKVLKNLYEQKANQIIAMIAPDVKDLNFDLIDLDSIKIETIEDKNNDMD